MPKKVKKTLMLSAERLGLKGERKQAYVFGTLQKIEKAEKRKK